MKKIIIVLAVGLFLAVQVVGAMAEDHQRDTCFRHRHIGHPLQRIEHQRRYIGNLHLVLSPRIHAVNFAKILGVQLDPIL